MSSPQETAEAVLIVVRTIAKWLAYGVAGLLTLALFGGGTFWGYTYFTETLPKSQVQVVAGSPSEACKGEFPIMVVVLNKSSKTVEHVTAQMAAFISGHSTNYASYSSKATTDKILAPGERSIRCWSFSLNTGAPKDRSIADYEWSVEWYSVRFAD